MNSFKEKGVIKVEKYYERTKESFVSFSVNEADTRKYKKYL